MHCLITLAPNLNLEMLSNGFTQHNLETQVVQVEYMKFVNKK